MPPLKYHALAVKLLKAKTSLNRVARSAVQVIERQNGRLLPAAVREWYSLAAADADTGLPIRTDWLAAHIRAARAAKGGPLELRVLLDTEHDGGLYVKVVGDDPDPPVLRVYEYLSSGGPDEWEDPEPVGRFSEYVRDAVWEASSKAMPRLWVIDAVFNPHTRKVRKEKVIAGPPHIDFLTDCGFELVGHSVREVDDEEDEYPDTLMYLGPGNARVEVNAYGDPATKVRKAGWQAAAPTEAKLFALYQRLWPMHGFTVAMRTAGEMGARDAERAMIARFRKKFPDAAVDEN